MTARLSSPLDRRAIELFLQRRVAEILEVPAGGLDSSATLMRLGLDSLGMLQLTESIESGLGREFPRVARLDELSIASLVESLEKGPSFSARDSSTPEDRMWADCDLPEDIRPEGVAAVPPRSILLTGATGFLGAYLLRALLRTTKARVVCLARPGQSDGQRDIRGRIRDNLTGYGIWEDEFDDRMEVLAADLSQPRLGVSPGRFDALAETIDAVVHGAASVNWVQPYPGLRASNVLAVKELLRLACRARVKPFHFISTLAVCYSTSEPREIDETGGGLEDLRGIHLPYAQSKFVAETLARTAAERGLPVGIFRLSFISGDSMTGASNTADFISTFIQGCVRMGAAPDLDWNMDSLPVDYAAHAISRLAFSHSGRPFRTYHLANPRVRHWREFVLWMNLYGYPLELIPYEDWLERLEAGVRQVNHPLASLAPFFRRKVNACEGLYLPQLYEESRKRRVRSNATQTILDRSGLSCPALSARLIDRYFSYFVERRFLPEVATRPAVVEAPLESAAGFFRRIFPRSGVVHAVPEEFSGNDSVIGELTSWKFGPSIGLHGYRVEFRNDVTEQSEALSVVVKIKAQDTQVIEVGKAVATLCSPELGEAYSRFSACLGLEGADTRELAVYKQNDDRFRRNTPAFYGGLTEGARTILVLERLSEMGGVGEIDGIEMLNSTDRLDSWRPSHIEAAIEGIAEIHSISYRRAGEFSDRSWLGHIPTGADALEARDLWTALARQAEPIFSQWAGPQTGAVQSELIENMNRWWREIESMPRAVIHNDCNPRNLAFRRVDGGLRLCLYDWELATVGLPQHDLAELLCFVVGSQFRRDDLFRYIECHRRALERASGRAIDPARWIRGFRLSLYDLMINRFPVYAMIRRFQPQRFLERVIRTWAAILETLPEIPA